MVLFRHTNGLKPFTNVTFRFPKHPVNLQQDPKDAENFIWNDSGKQCRLEKNKIIKGVNARVSQKNVDHHTSSIQQRKNVSLNIGLLLRGFASSIRFRSFILTLGLRKAKPLTSGSSIRYSF